MCSLASSTPVAALSRSYMRKTNLSNVFTSVYVTSVGNWLRLLKVSVTTSNTSHDCHADFFHFPLKANTTSHPVKPWKYIIPLALAGPLALRSSWIGNHYMPTPWPKAVHKVSTPISCSCGNTDTAITAISVSLALITRALLPSIAASWERTNIRVSASSCRHGDTASNDFWLSLQMTHPSFVTRVVLVVCVWKFCPQGTEIIQSCCRRLSGNFSNVSGSWMYL